MNSCWTQLGLAIRLSQSIGLHVELDATARFPTNTPSIQDMRRRVWYSLYVLDQLVALQLSRPPAIRQGDFNTLLPARLEEDARLDEIKSTQTNTLGTPLNQEPWSGDYFLSMINFSHIIGQVLTSLYSPGAALLDETTLSTIESFDQTLTQWKLSLPRSLRFDLGHAFENSIMFRRQVSVEVLVSTTLSQAKFE